MVLSRSVFTAAIAWALLIGGGQALRAQDAPDYAQVVETAVSASIRPAYDSVAEAFAELDETLSARCRAGNTPDGPEVGRAFAGAVAAWGGAQHLRFGPVMEEDRYLSIFFWPDPRNFTSRHLSGLKAALGDKPLSAESLAQMSVAVQSLSAFERVMTDPEQASEIGLPRCDLALAITANLSDKATATAAAWQEGATYPLLLTEPGAENPLYRDDREAMSELFKALGSGLQFLSERTLLPVVGASIEAARPRRAAFRRSGLTMMHLQAMVTGLEAYYLEGGIADAVAAGNPEIDARIRDRFQQLSTTLDAIEGPFAESVVDPDQRSRWRYALTLAELLVREVNGGASAALGLSRGFNAFDGD
ncbi:imelysin family protein [Algihabitans albus]|uniref:imelysin family protein n=1 Tax=Algihabitans albus TaxID=2164067 RepID=UPI000E5C9171|nr:imelysin family protein [Algihabitans albus]